jgi:ATP/maltotriose-dependent transcriptional regulator MalT
MAGLRLTFSEISAELFVYRNSIKARAVSICRKLGSATRRQAVARARELGSWLRF